MNNGLMIDVRNLTKRYAGTTAIEDLSFSVKRGDIVGFLGPNGAGKSTTMRILAGFMPATSGSVRIGGFDVFHQTKQVHRILGYMPENNPLHFEMRVKEYLKFRARLKGLGGKFMKQRIDYVLDRCSLADVRRRIIGQLSKGFKQRVGLADALLHAPELIILDEPTIGLDPNQIRSVRELIKSLAGKHTVLISTHILYEVEMTCNRVLIMNNGKLLVSDSTQNIQRLMSGGEQIVIELGAARSTLQRAFSSIPEIAEFEINSLDDGFSRCVLSPSNGSDLREYLSELARLNNWVLRELSRGRHSLEDVFVHMTGAGEEGDA